QVANLYDALRLPPDFVVLLWAELEELVKRRKRLAEREVGALKRAVTELEQKEVRLTDEMLAGSVERELYEKMARKYREERRQTEIRLSQLDVDDGDSTDFIDNCARLAGRLGELHRQFDFEQQKNLLRAVFARIYVQDRTIVN